MTKIYTLMIVASTLHLLNPVRLIAQTRIVTGIVTENEDKTPIPGAAISIKNTTKGTTTNVNGNFKIEVNGSGSLVISFVGYLTETVPTAGKSNIEIQLRKDTKSLNEIVVTALGIGKQSKALGYSVQTVNRKMLTQAEDPNLINNLSGKVAGVVITNGGAGVGSTSRIIVRGENSFNGSNQPLFVVDGVPVNNETFFNNAIENSSGQGTWAEVDWGNGASEINPNDISKVTVLKGSTAAALYGSRAANGAVVLTTQKGIQEKGLIGVSFNSTNTWESPLKLPRLQNEYGAGVNAYPLTGTPNTYSYVNGGGSSENNIPNWGLKFDPNLKVVIKNESAIFTQIIFDGI